ncbi:MAG: hypothetical protein V2I50_13870 [Desulfuromusa sp.]|jgi:hypothetical protein|nr:hypothetical protein [Desulfuromusa sp.]
MEKPASDITPGDLKKLHAGLTASTEELFQLILDPDSSFLKTLLKNPQINEEHLLSLLKRRDLSEELINSIFNKNKQSLSHRIILALVRNPATPGTLIRILLPQLRLFELVDLCHLPGATPDQKLAAERTILQRLPTTPLGSKITLARRGTTNVVAELMKEGQPQLFEACLGSPRLREAAIYQFLRGATASAETISMVARHNRWNQRPNLRLAILKNVKTPEIWFTLWLPQLHTVILKQLSGSFRAHPTRKHLIETELKKRAGF